MHNSSFGQILKINPSWIGKRDAVGARKATLDHVDKDTIQYLINKNSEAFLKKEKSHI